MLARACCRFMRARAKRCFAARRGVAHAAQLLCASGLERCIADVSLISGRLSRRVGPPIKIEDGRPAALRVLIVARHDASTRAWQAPICGLQRGARMKRQQALDLSLGRRAGFRLAYTTVCRADPSAAPAQPGAENKRTTTGHSPGYGLPDTPGQIRSLGAGCSRAGIRR